MPPEAQPATTEEASARIARPYAELLEIARTATSRHNFLHEALRCIVQQLGSPYAAIYARVGSAVIQEEAHAGPTSPTFWQGAVQQFLTDSLAEDASRAKLLSAPQADLKIALLSAPLNDGSNGISGAIAVVVQGGRDDAHAALQRLEALATVTASAVGFVGLEPETGSSVNAAGSAQALSRAAAVTSPEELAFAITNGLRSKLGCEQAALSVVSGSRVRILSISGLDDVHKRSPGVVQIRAAMEECLDAEAPVVCQQDSSWAEERVSTGHRLHRQWRAATGGDAVASIPMMDAGRCVAIISLRKRGDEAFQRSQIDEIIKLVTPFAAALKLVQRARRGLLRHTWDATWETLGSIMRPGRVGTQIAVLVAIAAAIWFAFGTMDYRFTVPARILPATQRHIATPYDAVLRSAPFQAGDVVRAGDVLCEFDQRDLLLERERLVAQRAVHERERMRAQAADQPVEARLAEAELRLVQAQLDITNRRIEQATIRAPHDGVIIRGDLHKEIGSVLAQGTPLFEVAPLTDWKLELDAPEASAAVLRNGLQGRFASHARPEQPQPFELTRVRPSAEVRGGQNVYVAEARIADEAEWIRPGMEGMAQVEAGPRRVWWVLLHRAIDAMRLRFWL
jgi:multidrug resistance efflux pump